MTQQPFHVGDRVVMAMAFPGVPQGTRGTIRKIFRNQSEIYWVFFDAHDIKPIFVGSAMLTHVPHTATNDERGKNELAS
jgi:hypothetical protein